MVNPFGGERGRGDKITRADEGNGWISKGNYIGPGGVLVSWWAVVGSEEDLVTKNNGTVGWISGVVVPFTPPAGTGITGGMVIRVMAVEVNREGATDVAVGRCWVAKTAV